MTGTAHLIYFSATGTTRKIVESIALGLGAGEVQRHDLTPPGAGIAAELADGVAVIGVPVYAGRVPELCLERLAGLTARGVPAVLVALYGNREFEDALVELRDVCLAKGFRVVAAGAFIGEHSYSTPQQPIAAGRPDAEDLAVARSFGERVAGKIAGQHFATPEIAGQLPYRERVRFGGVAPETDPARCTFCGQCAAVCPTGVVTVTDAVTTLAENCIICCACVKACKFGARVFNHPHIAQRREMLVKNCSAPKVPSLFI